MAESDTLVELVNRVASGDHKALRDLLGHCPPDMAARIRALPHGNEADDILQDALLQACRKLTESDGFVWKGWEAFQAWVWVFVKNAYRDHRKRNGRKSRDKRRVVEDAAHPEAGTSQVGVLDKVAGRDESPSRPIRRQERDDRLRQAMRDELTEDQRLAIELRYFEYLSVEEVFERMGWDPSKVKMLCKRGIERLRQVLTESMRLSGTS